MIVADRLKDAVFLSAGILLLIAVAKVARSTFDFLHHSRLATGRVVAGPYGPHHVTVRFRTAAGEEVAYHQNGAITLHTGEVVVVRYDPSDPALDPCVDRFGAIWGAGGDGKRFRRGWRIAVAPRARNEARIMSRDIAPGSALYRPYSLRCRIVRKGDML